jgi:ribosomal protein S4
MSTIAKRRFHTIARLGDIPGLTRITTKLLRRKRKNYFKPKFLKHKKDETAKNSEEKTRTRINLDDFHPLDYNYATTFYKDTLKFEKKIRRQKKLKYIIQYFFQILKKENIRNPQIRDEKKIENKLTKWTDGISTFLTLKFVTRYLYHLRERQRTKYHYGLKDYQLYKYSKKYAKEKISKCHKSPAYNLKKNLDTRLDSALFYLGISPTMKAARQLIIHKKVSVNAKIIAKPSYICKTNDTISYQISKKERKPIIFAYGKILRNRTQKIIKVNTNVLLEYYLKKLS